ncbi:MAG: tetratricopeptide repeat protein [bacterium]|nr:tetratricopeptide repeat protein [bacterium]
MSTCQAAPRKRSSSTAASEEPLVRTIILGLVLLALLIPASVAFGKKKQGGVVGRVVNADLEALEGAQVTVTSELEAELRMEETTDKDGKFTVKIRDPAGGYLFRVEKEGYFPYEATLQLLPGELQEAEFRLVDEATGKKNLAVLAFNAGVAALDARDMATAVAKFLEAAELDPELAPPHLGLADIYLSQENYEAAAAEADRVLALEPDNFQGMGHAFQAHSRLGHEARVNELIDAMRDTEIAPALATRVFNQAVLAAREGDNARAAEKFRTATELDPQLAEAHAALASMLYNQSAFAEALTTLDKLFEIDPQNVQGHRVRFLVYEALGDETQAAVTLDAYLAIDPADAAGILYQHADMDFREGDVAKATATLLRILEVQPEMARAHYTLGLCYASIDPEKAKHHLRKFIELAPDDPEVRDARQMLSYL